MGGPHLSLLPLKVLLLLRLLLFVPTTHPEHTATHAYLHGTQDPARTARGASVGPPVSPFWRSRCCHKLNSALVDDGGGSQGEMFLVCDISLVFCTWKWYLE